MDYRFDTVAIVVSQHYRLLRNLVTSSTSVRLPTHEEALMADYLTDVLETVVGHKLANYCRERFRQGWMTRDLRSYKIKFVLTKLRDTLKEGAAKEELKTRLSRLTENAEQLAGCKTDSKRRNKQAREEQARKREEREEQRRLYEESKPQQMLLFDDINGAIAPGTSESSSLETTKLSEDLLDDIDLLVVPVQARTEEEHTAEEPVRRKKNGNTKKSRADKRFEKLTQEILRSEYPEDAEEDLEDEDEFDDPDANLRDIERSCGIYFNHRTFEEEAPEDELETPYED